MGFRRYQFTYHGQLYIFEGRYYDYIVGDSTEFPRSDLSHRLKYVLTLARQNYARRRRRQHRLVNRRVFTVIK